MRPSTSSSLADDDFLCSIHYLHRYHGTCKYKKPRNHIEPYRQVLRHAVGHCVQCTVPKMLGLTFQVAWLDQLRISKDVYHATSGTTGFGKKWPFCHCGLLKSNSAISSSNKTLALFFGNIKFRCIHLKTKTLLIPPELGNGLPQLNRQTILYSHFSIAQFCYSVIYCKSHDQLKPNRGLYIITAKVATLC